MRRGGVGKKTSKKWIIPRFYLGLDRLQIIISSKITPNYPSRLIIILYGRFSNNEKQMKFSLYFLLHWFNNSSLYFGCPSVSVVMLLFIIDCWFIGEDNSYQRTSIIQLYWSVSPSVMQQKTNMTNEHLLFNFICSFVFRYLWNVQSLFLISILIWLICKPKIC